MRNAEEKLQEWRVLYREWSDLEHRLQSRDVQEGESGAAEMKVRSRDLQQQCASALAELQSAVVAMRERRERRENIS